VGVLWVNYRDKKVVSVFVRFRARFSGDFGRAGVFRAAVTGVTFVTASW
jgi:hypothetical protein